MRGHRSPSSEESSREADAKLLVTETGHEDEIVSMAPEADAILTNWKRVPVAALEAAPRCCIVARYGVGVDNIPVDRATELGILVANVPDFCTAEVSRPCLGPPACVRPSDRSSRPLDARGALEPRNRSGPAPAERTDARPRRLRRHRPCSRSEGSRARPACPRVHTSPPTGARARRRPNEQLAARARRVRLRLASRPRNIRDAGV